MEELVKRYSEKLRGLKLVMLFGSRARGDFTESSDVDVLVVADDLPTDPREAYAMLRELEYPNANPTGMNTKTFLNKLRSENPFIMEILEDGKPLYSDKEFLSEVVRIYSDVRRKWSRKGKLWVRKGLSTASSLVESQSNS